MNEVSLDPRATARRHSEGTGWRVYRVAPDGAVIYDRWIEQNALMTAAHADPSRPVPVLCAPRRQPA